MGIKSEKTFEEIVERIVALFKPERRLHRDDDDHRIDSYVNDADETDGSADGSADDSAGGNGEGNTHGSDDGNTDSHTRPQ
jgi:hypothetical protein